MSVTELVHINLTSAPVLAFALGVLAAALRTDLRLPDQVTSMLSTYLLLAIGFKGGVALAATDLGEIAPPLAATLLLGIATPTIAFTQAAGRPDAAGTGALRQRLGRHVHRCRCVHPGGAP